MGGGRQGTRRHSVHGMPRLTAYGSCSNGMALLACSMRLVMSPASGCPSKFMKRTAGTCGGCRASVAVRLKAGPPAAAGQQPAMSLGGEACHRLCLACSACDAWPAMPRLLPALPHPPGCRSSSGSRCSSQCWPSWEARRSASLRPYLGQ